MTHTGWVVRQYPPHWLVVKQAGNSFVVVDTSVRPTAAVFGPAPSDQAHARARTLQQLHAAVHGQYRDGTTDV